MQLLTACQHVTNMSAHNMFIGALAASQTPAMGTIDTCCPATSVCYRGRHAGRSDYEMYAESKVKLFMLTAELQRRLHATGSTTDVFSVHPGVAQTEIFPKSDQDKLGARVLAAGAVAVGQSPGGGARSILKVATDPSLAGNVLTVSFCCCQASRCCKP